MRIAVSGTHNTGKTTLVADLGARLPGHRIVPEPYEILENRGYVFEHPPSVEDFLMQMRQSLTTLRRPWPNVVLDRCPLDFLAYIDASPGADRFDLERWREPITTAMKTLDLVIVMHVDPDHDPEISDDDPAFRLAVDDLLRDLADGDAFDLCEGVDVLPIDGAWGSRADLVLAHIAARGGLRT